VSTRDDIIQELREVHRDLDAFVQARQLLEARVQEMDQSPRQEMFVKWAAMQVIMNALIIGIVRCEGLVSDYNKVLESMEAPDNIVSLVRKGDQDGNG
jgi:hypothetical protein